MAIAFDTGGSTTNLGLGTIQWTHTIGAGGSNRIIFAHLLAAFASGNGSATNITFAGTNMTRIILGTNVSGGFESELWYLLNPPTGLGTFHGTFSSANGNEDNGLSASYSGVNQTTPIAGSTFKIGTATNAGIAIGRTIAANAWFLGGGHFDNNTGTISTGNLRGTAGNGGMIVGADNIAGTLVFSNSNTASNWVLLGAELSPFVVANQTVAYKTLMGVGQV